MSDELTVVDSWKDESRGNVEVLANGAVVFGDTEEVYGVASQTGAVGRRIARLARELEESRAAIRKLAEPIIAARPAKFGWSYITKRQNRQQKIRRTVVWSEEQVQAIMSNTAVRTALADGEKGGPDASEA